LTRTIWRCTEDSAVELDDLEHLDELVELLGHLLQRQLLDVDDDGHAGDLGVLGRADGEGVDVEAAPGEQAAIRARTPGLFSTRTDRVCLDMV
jgi:hypothetical protein